MNPNTRTQCTIEELLELANETEDFELNEARHVIVASALRELAWFKQQLIKAQGPLPGDRGAVARLDVGTLQQKTDYAKGWNDCRNFVASVNKIHPNRHSPQPKK